jgi:hypothetical protein
MGGWRDYTGGTSSKNVMIVINAGRSVPSVSARDVIQSLSQTLESAGWSMSLKDAQVAEPVKIFARRGFIFLRSFNSLKTISPPPSPSPIKGEDLSWWIASITPSPLETVSYMKETNILKERRGGRVEKI